MVNRRLVTLLTLLLLAGAWMGCSDSGEPVDPEATVQKEPRRDTAAIEANNRGVGLMGRFEYAQAAQVFERLVEQYPDWQAVQVNWAIAILNRQNEGDEEKALAIVDRVLQANPENVRAHYVAGLLRLYLSSPAEAMSHFQAVVEVDPSDAYATYYLAQCLAQQGQVEEALHWYRRAVEQDPYLRSAYYGAFQALQRLKRRDEARALMKDYQRLANNPRARLAEFKYTRMGPKSEAMVVDRTAVDRSTTPPEGPVFGPRTMLIDLRESNPAGANLPELAPRSVTVADIDGDGQSDLFVAGVSPRGAKSNRILLWREDEGYVPEPEHPLSSVAGINAVVWGDYDNDGLMDVYFCRDGPNQLWQQTAEGWQDVTERSGTANGDAQTRDGLFVDADHDGDLDLFLVNWDSPNELLNNNLDGTFRPLAAEQGLAGEGRKSRTALAVDLDQDRDADLVIINDSPPHEIYLNDRLWRYRAAEDFATFLATPALSALALDADANGQPELYTISPQGELLRWQQQNPGELVAQKLASVASPEGWALLASQDIQGDGQLELLVTRAQGWLVLDSLTGKPYAAGGPSEGHQLVGSTVLVTPNSGPAITALSEDSKLLFWPPGSGRFPFLALTLSGREDRAQSMRSNASGVGARVSIRTDSRWTITDTFRQQSGPGQNQQPLAVGLAGAERADFIAIDWSDGVFQSELDLEVGKEHHISETQRQLSSCPVLFAWDGNEFQFVADLLGVGGLGYAVAPGEYATPRPWEYFLLPPGLMQPKEGRYLLKLTEPMEEVTYLDHVRLVAYDLPPGWRMFLDERIRVQGPKPSGEPRFYRHEILPERVLNERGEIVTDTLLSADGRAAPVGKLDRRFIGLLRAEHILTLRFAQPLDSELGVPWLVIDGWVEYPYSQTSFAAWQAGASFQAPTLEARALGGEWTELYREFGYPAGMPRRMALPLTGLPVNAAELRLRTNQQIYWDRIAVVFAENPPKLKRRDLPLMEARLAKVGFPARSTQAQFRPDYDYAERLPFWDTRYLAGYYTRLGNVHALVEKRDDALAIFGPGEEIHLAFGVAPPVEEYEGGTRYWVLESYGWTKDMDLFTQHGETVGPIPRRDHASPSRERLHAAFNTRYQEGG